MVGLGVEGEGALPEGIVGVPREAAVVAADQITEIFVADRGAVIQMVYIVEIADLELIGGFCSMQGKGFLVLVVDYGHDILPSCALYKERCTELLCIRYLILIVLLSGDY